MNEAGFYRIWDEKRRREAAETAVLESVVPVDPERATAYARKALESECEAVATAQRGTRNDTLNKAAFRMGRHVGAGAIDPGSVHAALRRAGLACGLPADEVELVLRDNDNAALTTGQALPRHPAPREPLPAVTTLNGSVAAEVTGTDPVTEVAEQATSIRDRFPILDWHELWAAEDDEEWIVEPILPARRLVALFSAPKVGKSLLMLEIAVAVARGQTVLGVTPDRARRVLYVDFENDPRGDVRTRLQAMGLAPEDLADLCYLSYPTLAKLDTAMGAYDLMSAVAEYGCEVVVIDTISRAVGGEENENDTWLSFYRHTGMAMKQAGVSCIRLDHTGKDHDRGMRGGSAKYGDVDAVWRLNKVTEDTYQLDCTDHRLPIPEKTLVLRRVTEPRLAHEVQAEGRGAAWAAKVSQAIAILDEAEVANRASREEAREVLQKYGHRVRNDVISAVVRERKRRVGILDERLSDADT